MNEVHTNSLKAWLLAARPKTLTGASIPVFIGCGLAYADHFFQLFPALICLLFAFLMQIDANFINDYFDFKKGSDREDRLGPERACAQGWITLDAMKKGIIFTSIIACLVGSLLLIYAGWEIIPVGLLCVLFAFLYTAGPYPLAYHGWGDILVLVFFGLVPVGFTYYIMSHTWTWDVTVAGLACGLVIDTLLMINNYRDRDQDRLSGKKTIIVRVGEETGSLLYLFVGLIAALLCLRFAFSHHVWAALLPQLYVILHYMTWKEMVQINHGKALNHILGKTSRNILIFGLLLTLGLII